MDDLYRDVPGCTPTPGTAPGGPTDNSACDVRRAKVAKQLSCDRLFVLNRCAGAIALTPAEKPAAGFSHELLAREP
eukprot:246580-Rhodomonas_salina.1